MSPFVIVPDYTFKFTWDIIGFCLIIYHSIIVPFYICFNLTPKGVLLYIGSSIDAFFLIDISKF